MKELIVLKEKLSKVTNNAYFVGGYVRDKFLGKPSKDIDIEVFDVEQSKLEEILNECAVECGFDEIELVGKQFGVYKLGNLDISLPRTEKCTGQGHRDFDVEVNPYLPIADAQQRRDLTINAIYENIFTKEIIDTTGGLIDLHQKLIRHTNAKTFVEDSLRVFRVAQFASRFEFEVDEKTLELCKQIDISALPFERIYEETKKAITKSNNVTIYFKILNEILGETKFFEVFKIHFDKDYFRHIDRYYLKARVADYEQSLKEELLMTVYFQSVAPSRFLTKRANRLIVFHTEKTTYDFFRLYQRDELTRVYTQTTYTQHLVKKFEKITRELPNGEEIKKRYSVEGKMIDDIQRAIFDTLIEKL